MRLCGAWSRVKTEHNTEKNIDKLESQAWRLIVARSRDFRRFRRSRSIVQHRAREGS